MIIRRTERLRMNILRILSILVPTSSPWKVKMLKVIKILKETTHPSMSSLLCASMKYRASAGCAEETNAQG
jgi:hypothetical protein